MGIIRLAQADGGTTTVFYPTRTSELPVSQGPFKLSLALDGEPHRGNERLVVISHGSSGSPWVHTDLARTLVKKGFTAAVPQHAGDNYLDRSEPGLQAGKDDQKKLARQLACYRLTLSFRHFCVWNRLVCSPVPPVGTQRYH